MIAWGIPFLRGSDFSCEPILVLSLTAIEKVSTYSSVAVFISPGYLLFYFLVFFSLRSVQFPSR